MSTKITVASNIINQKLTDYGLLVKFKLNLLVVFTSGMGFLLASPATINWVNFSVLCLGGFLVTGASNALNQVFEREYDKLMVRTQNRPLAAGRMTVNEAVLAAGLMGMLGIMLLAYLNPLTSLIGMISLMTYAFIYTPLKRVSPIAVWVGAIPGALPPMIGWIAVTGTLDLEAISLFSIQFIWQFPHFWAIAWVNHENYSNAGFNLLPSKGGRDKSTAIHCLLYALLIIPFGLAPYFLGISGIIAAVVVTILGIGYTMAAWQLYKRLDKESALRLMFTSFFYLPIVMIVLYLNAAF